MEKSEQSSCFIIDTTQSIWNTKLLAVLTLAETPTLKNWNFWFQNLHCEGGWPMAGHWDKGYHGGLQFITMTNSGWLANSFWNKGQTYWWWQPEIWRSPVEVGSLSQYLQGFIHPRWCRISSINSIFNKFYTEQVAQYLPIHGFMTALVQHSVSARKIWQPGCLSFSTRPLCLSFASLSQFTYDPQIYVKDKRPHKQKWCCRNCYDTMTSGQTIGFHQPGFALNKGFFLDTFWGEAVWGRYNLTRWHGIT